MGDANRILLEFMESTMPTEIGSKEVLAAAGNAFQELFGAARIQIFQIRENHLESISPGECSVEQKIEQKYFEACPAENADKPVCVCGRLFFSLVDSEKKLRGAAVADAADCHDEESRQNAVRLAKNAALRLAYAETHSQKVLHGKSTAAILSHEFKTPLTISLSSLQLLERNLKRNGYLEKDGNAAQYIEYIEQNLYRIQSLAENLLDAEYTDEQALIGDEQDFDLAQEVERITESVKPYALMHNIRFEFINNSKGMCRMFCAPRVPERILINLISNAFKHTPENGICTVRIEESAQEISISVENEGEPIRQTDFAHLFDRFWRGNGERNGSGLGLYLSKRLAQVYKWTISAENLKKGGVSFTLHIPRHTIQSGTNAVSSMAMLYRDDSLETRVRIALSGVNFPQK